jgi:hypothetical protein
MERVLVERCGREKIRPGTQCEGVSIYPEHYFFPSDVREEMYESDRKLSSKIWTDLAQNKDRRAFHFWSSKKGRQLPANKWTSDEFIWAQLSQTHCPVVSEYVITVM